MPDPPSFLFVLTDQWRRQALGCNGDPVLRTPHLDALAREGTNLRRVYTPNPVCSPARAALQTGRYPHQTGFVSNNLSFCPGETYLAQTLADAGYATGYIGKWHLYGAERPGFVAPDGRTGYQYFAGFNRGHPYHDPVYFTTEGEERHPGVFEPTYQADLAMDFMRERGEGPFFLMLSWGPPHMPYKPPAAFDRFGASDIPWRPNVPPAERANPDTVADICGYYGLCEALDAEFGRLMAFLRDSGLEERTVVVFTADHGDMHGCHAMHYKGKPHEESLGIPLLVRGPGVAAGCASDTPCTLVDLPPTLLSLAGVRVPGTMVGRDLSPALRGETLEDSCAYCEGRMQVRDPADAEMVRGEEGRYPDWRCLVTARHKLAVDCTGRAVLLTNLAEDPYELDNLADRPEAAPLQAELLTRLRDEGRRLGDPFPEAVEPSSPLP